MPQDDKDLGHAFELPCGLLREGEVIREVDLTCASGCAVKGVVILQVRVLLEELMVHLE